MTTASQEAVFKHQSELRGGGWRDPFIELSRNQEDLRNRIKAIHWAGAISFALVCASGLIINAKANALDARITALEQSVEVADD